VLPLNCVCYEGLLILEKDGNRWSRPICDFSNDKTSSKKKSVFDVLKGKYRFLYLYNNNLRLKYV
jgi:hypothetical protein